MLLEVRDLSKKMKNRKNINSGSFLERTKELDVMVAEINGTIE